MNEISNYCVSLTAIDCCMCGGTYAINECYRTNRQQDGRTWTCPYCGNSIGYTKSEVQKLREELARKDRRIQNLHAAHDQTKAELRETELRRRAEKAAKTRMQNRVANGVCPCCRRTFKDLAAHMHTKHPQFIEKPINPVTSV